MTKPDSSDYYLELAAEAEERAAQVKDADCRRSLYVLAQATQQLPRLCGIFSASPRRARRSPRCAPNASVRPDFSRIPLPSRASLGATLI